MKKVLLSGNEAIALGAYEAGVKVGAGYPGTPSTEILENLSGYSGVYTEWSVNEKVALEVGIGASLSGARTIVTMKHVGLNVAADPLFTSSYIGVKSGLVIVTADDPGMHSSQNEQDNRNFAYAAKIPMLEPSDSQEAKDFTRYAFELSEKYDTPIFLRTTTRISHSKSIVIDEKKNSPQNVNTGFSPNPQKYVMIPTYARIRSIEVEKRIRRITQDSNNFAINRIEFTKNREIGFITSGISFNYVKEVFPKNSILKLGMIYPLPEKLIKEFCSKFKKVYVVEELDPFLELRIKALGLMVEGKNIFPSTGEFDADVIRKLTGKSKKKIKFDIDITIPSRPPSLCAGCPHRTVFEVLNKLKTIVSGDIGCYTLGVFPPFNSMDTCIDMGASIGIAQGIEIAEDKNYKNNVVAVIGDSTFAHSGITGLINAAYNKRNSLIIVLDNGTTAMTGIQPNPFSGETIRKDKTVIIDYKKLAEAVGIKDENFKIVDAYKKVNIESVIRSMLSSKKLSLLVIKGMCMILRKAKQI